MKETAKPSPISAEQAQIRKDSRSLARADIHISRANLPQAFSRRDFHAQPSRAEATANAPLRLTRRGLLGLVGGILAAGAALGVGTTLSVQAFEANQQHSSDLQHPNRLPAHQVDQVTVLEGQNGTVIAGEFTDPGDPSQFLANIIGQQGNGPDHALMPGQIVLVPKELEQFQPPELSGHKS